MTDLLLPQNNLQVKTGVFMSCMPIEIFRFLLLLLTKHFGFLDKHEIVKTILTTVEFPNLNVEFSPMWKKKHQISIECGQNISFGN